MKNGGILWAEPIGERPEEEWHHPPARSEAVAAQWEQPI